MQVTKSSGACRCTAVRAYHEHSDLRFASQTFQQLVAMCPVSLSTKQPCHSLWIYQSFACQSQFLNINISPNKNWNSCCNCKHLYRPIHTAQTNANKLQQTVLPLLALVAVCFHPTELLIDIGSSIFSPVRESLSVSVGAVRTWQLIFIRF